MIKIYKWINWKFEEQDIYIVSKYLPTKYVLITKWKGNFTMGKPGRHHLDQVVKASLCNKTNPNHTWADGMQWELRITFDVLPNMYKPEQTRGNMRKRTSMDIQQNNWPVFFNSVKVMKA